MSDGTRHAIHTLLQVVTGMDARAGDVITGDTRWRVSRANPPIVFPDLLAKVRAATPPYDDELAAAIEAAYRCAYKVPTRVSTYQGAALVAGVAVAAVFPVALGLSLAAAGALAVTGIHRYRLRGVVARFCREAVLVHARALAPEGRFDHADLVGNKELLLELPERGRARVAYFAADFTSIPILVAPDTKFVLVFDPQAGPHVGIRIPAELPSATLQLGNR